MKRRTFLRLTGALASLGLPWNSLAEQYRTAKDSAVLPPEGSLNQCQINGELWDMVVGNTVFKLVGVGGGGGSTVERMIREGYRGIEYICCDTDLGELTRSSAPIKLLLGSGTCSGGNAEISRQFARLERSRIAETLAGAHMVFITAGLGGGTGTGAAPIVAEVARELGIVTVALVTKPFVCEGNRSLIAEAGAIELARHVDALITIPQEMLMDADNDEVGMEYAKGLSDDLLKNTITGMIDIVNRQDLVGVDFDDIRSIMVDSHGWGRVASSTASGRNRASRAASAVMSSPLLQVSDIDHECNYLVIMTGSRSLGLDVYREVMGNIRNGTSSCSTVIAGVVMVDSMRDDLRVTVVALGKHQQSS